MKFVDLFAGLGGFHRALTRLGHECVFACEINDELRQLYARNFMFPARRIGGDIRLDKKLVPRHDILCAGFPCQPFSKSGSQEGTKDRTRGTLFHEILDVIDARRPRLVLLENVGNFERHDRGRTWKVVRDSLSDRGYHVRGTEHMTSGGHGLISPHHFGFPHHRERFFIAASLKRLPDDPFPRGDRLRRTSLADILQTRGDLCRAERDETALTQQQINCIEHWNAFIQALPASMPLPSFPIWGDELWERYGFEDGTPHVATLRQLREGQSDGANCEELSKEQLIAKLPSYAREPVARFAPWKVDFIRKNREWLSEARRFVPGRWINTLREFPPSLRKLEWNCKGESRDLWQHVLQFRPSGLRVKRFSSCPALVAMTVTQIPILGPKHRFVSRVEGLRLQGFPDNHELPKSREAAFRALGNAVHAGVVEEIVHTVLNGKSAGNGEQLPLPLWDQANRRRGRSVALQGAG